MATIASRNAKVSEGPTFRMGKCVATRSASAASVWKSVECASNTTPGMSSNRGAQRRRFGLVVAEHLRVAHVDAGLHHQGDDAADRVADPGFGEGRAMKLERAMGRLGLASPPASRALRFRRLESEPRCRRHRRGRGRRAPLRRRRTAPRRVRRSSPRTVRDRRRSACSRRGGSWRSRPRRTPAPCRALRPSLRSPAGLPRVRPEVVAAQNDARRIDAFAARQILDEGPEGGGRHSGVAAAMVHLIAGGLDQDRLVAVAMGGERRAQRLRMRGAPRGDPAPLAGAIVGDQRSPEVRVGHERRARKSSRVANELLPSIGPTLVTASAPAALARSRAWRKLNLPERSG